MEEDYVKLDMIVKFYEAIQSMRDPYEDGHARRVEELAVALGKVIGLDEVSLKNLEYASRLHDLGKILISEEIANKPRLTESEMIMMHAHSAMGVKLLRTIGIGDAIANPVEQHHENFDGSGYPLGLTGEEIDIHARILRIADTFDAITSMRPYHPLRTIRGAHKEMEKCAKDYDPNLIEKFWILIRDSY